MRFVDGNERVFRASVWVRNGLGGLAEGKRKVGQQDSSHKEDRQGCTVSSRLRPVSVLLSQPREIFEIHMHRSARGQVPMLDLASRDRQERHSKVRSRLQGCSRTGSVHAGIFVRY